MFRAMHPEIHAVLFDVDGTLIDSYRLYLEAYRRALEPVLGYAPDDAELTARRPSAERLFLSEWVGPELAEQCHQRMCQHYESLHGALAEGAYDGVREMLAHLRSAGLRLGVVTGKGRRAWEITVRHLDLGPFEVVVTEDDAEHPKPDPGGLLRALEALGVPPERAAYVGDSLGDLQAGRAAGVRVGAALWPKTDPADRQRFLESLGVAPPHWLLEHPADLSRVLAPWC